MIYQLNRTDTGGFGECPAIKVDPIIVGSILIYELVVRPTKIIAGEQITVTFGRIEGSGFNQKFVPTTTRLAMSSRQYGDFASDVEYRCVVPNPLLAEVGLRGATIHAVQKSGASADSPCLLFSVVGIPGQSEYVIPELSPTELSVVETLDRDVLKNTSDIANISANAVVDVKVVGAKAFVTKGIGDLSQQSQYDLPKGEQGIPGVGVPGPSVAAGMNILPIYERMWTNTDNVYLLTVTPEQHQLGSTPNILVFFAPQNNGTFEPVSNDYTVSADGVVETTSAVPWNGCLYFCGGFAGGVDQAARQGNEENAQTLEAHILNKFNPHSVTKSQIGLENVPNTDCTNAGNISSGVLGDIRISSSLIAAGDNLTVNRDANGIFTIAASFGTVAPYVKTIKAGDWTGADGDYKYTILGAEHLKGVYPSVSIVGAGNTELSDSFERDKTPDGFNGNLIFSQQFASEISIIIK